MLRVGRAPICPRSYRCSSPLRAVGGCQTRRLLGRSLARPRYRRRVRTRPCRSGCSRSSSIQLLHAPFGPLRGIHPISMDGKVFTRNGADHGEKHARRQEQQHEARPRDVAPRNAAFHGAVGRRDATWAMLTRACLATRRWPHHVGGLLAFEVLVSGRHRELRPCPQWAAVARRVGDRSSVGRCFRAIFRDDRVARWLSNRNAIAAPKWAFWMAAGPSSHEARGVNQSPADARREAHDVRAVDPVGQARQASWRITGRLR